MRHHDGNDVRFLHLWGSIFGISDNANQTHEDAIAVSLVVFRDEIDLVRARLSGRGCPDYLFDNYLIRIRNLAAPSLLQQDWRSHKNGLQGDVKLSLEWAAWCLQDEEDALPADQLTALRAELDAIERAVADSGLSPHVSDFVRRQIDLIRVALRHYDIAGIAKVEDALERTIGAFTKNRAMVTQAVEKSGPDGRRIFERVSGCLTGLADTADKVDKIRKGIDGIASIGHAVGATLDGVMKALSALA